MADQVSTTVRSMVEKVLEADVADQISRRGRELAAAVGEATDTASARAAEAWRESAPTRREAEKSVRRASNEAMGWSRRTWKRNIGPAVRELWSRRAVAVGAAGAAVPVGREMVQDAAVRLGIRRRRERRHWAAFFVGMILGAAIGAAIAVLTTPKPGREMRDELADRARDAAERAREAAGATDWVPLFQRPAENGEGSQPVEAVPPPEPTMDAIPPEGEEPH